MFGHHLPLLFNRKEHITKLFYVTFDLSSKHRCNGLGELQSKFGNRAAVTNNYKLLSMHYRLFPCTHIDVHARVTAFVIVKMNLAIFRAWYMGKQFSKLFPWMPCLFPALKQEIKMLIYMYIEKHWSERIISIIILIYSICCLTSVLWSGACNMRDMGYRYNSLEQYSAVPLQRQLLHAANRIKHKSIFEIDVRWQRVIGMQNDQENRQYQFRFVSLFTSTNDLWNRSYIF